MRGVLSVLLAASLLAFVVAHVALVVGIWRARLRLRAPLALVVPPLAPFWGYELGFTRRAYTWLGALALYMAILVALSG
ncbi:MAG: hypothetical protein ABI461_00605 [Polyangiaceae bacterium]